MFCLILIYQHKPVKAEIFNGFNEEIFESWWDDISQVYQELYQDWTIQLDNVEAYIDTLSEDFATVWQESLGELGFIDLDSVKNEVAEMIDSLSDVKTGQDVFLKEEMAQTLIRSQVQQNASQYISIKGQEKTLAKIDFNQQTAMAIQQQAQEAQQAVSTHDAIKNMAAIQAQQATLNGALHQEILESQQTQALTNLSLNQIDQNLSAISRRESLSRMAMTLKLLEYNPNLR